MKEEWALQSVGQIDAILAEDAVAGLPTIDISAALPPKYV